MSARTHRTSLFVLLGAILAVLGLLTATPAQAHDQLVSSNPKDGAVVKKQPEFLTMNFSGDIQKTGTEIKVMHDGKDVSAGEVTIKGTKLTSALPDDLSAGKYSVVWRVVSQDGHPVSGKWGFTIADGNGAGGGVNDDKTGEAAAGQSSDAGQGAGLGAVSGGAVDDNSQNSSSGVSAPVIVLIVIGVIAVVLIVVLLFWRKSKGFGNDEAK